MDKVKILFVEDDESILNAVTYILNKDGYEVLPLKSAEEALESLGSFSPDLVLLDLNLPEMGGIEFASIFKAKPKYSNTPVIILTGVDIEETIVEALEKYADDYIIKPFRPRVVQARIKALLRRTLGHKGILSTENILKINLVNHEVLLGGKPIDLTLSEFNILQFLYKNPNRPFSREEIITAIRGEDYHVESRSLDFQIFGIRKKFGKHSGLIETVRGIGFKYRENA